MIIKLNDDDLREILAEKFNAKKNQIRFDSEEKWDCDEDREVTVVGATIDTSR